MSHSDQLVTVGVCVFNGAEFVGESIESALAQTHENLEIIVFDDGSTDGTLQIVRGFSDPRICVIRSQSNLGVGRAREAVKGAAAGDYMVWLDADDLFHPHRIQRLLSQAELYGADLACDSYQLMNSSGEPTGSFYRIPAYVTCESHFTRLFERNRMIPHPLISRRCFLAVDYDPTLRVSDDYDYWLKCSYQGFVFSYEEAVGLSYRLTEDSLSTNHKKSRAETRQILSKYAPQELQRLYLVRGYPQSLVDYMLCVRSIFVADYAAALAFAEKPWPTEDHVDKDFYLGTLHLRNRSPALARSYLERYLERFPDSPAGYNNLGVLLRASGDQTVWYFEQALRLLPDYRDAKENLENPELEAVTDTEIRA